MKKIHLWLILFFLCAAQAGAQVDDERGGNRLLIGGELGVFRVSHEDFSDLYGNRLGFAPGGQVMFRINSPYNVVVKYRRFSKTNDFQDQGQTFAVRWREDFYNLGLRYMSGSQQGAVNYFTFGFAFLSIKETGGRSLFLNSTSAERKKSPTGFYLDFGLHYYFASRVALLVELEITSAGLEGRSSFEGSSVGGFNLSSGLSIFLF